MKKTSSSLKKKVRVIESLYHPQPCQIDIEIKEDFIDSDT